TRSHSVVTTETRSADGEEEKDTVSDKDDIFKRSVSADRHSLLSQQGRLNIGGGLGSARSSVSELSAISGHSTTTYVHENSTLVIECMENRIRKYYLVPPHLAETGKWKKRGKKLHIYNDHTFVAKHISSGKICEICTVRLPFALGKQGYQCRDCKMICHKECHVRAPSYCPKTSVYDIEL
ncbi:Protein kinase C zeta type, partial [Orchesella cincta]